MKEDVQVIDDTERAQVLLHPARLALLAHLGEPRSAADLGRLLDLPRQRINYHLRELEAQGLIEVQEERRRGSVVERAYRRTGQGYTISDGALGLVGTHPEAVQDRFSAAYQIALASQTVREIGRLREAARVAEKELPTFALASDVRFASAAARAAFAEELVSAVGELVRRYHDERASGGRWFRFHLGGYPRPDG
jgi:DNA-binding transcriptional ArsR family regulator